MSDKVNELATKFVTSSTIETRIKIGYTEFDDIVTELTGHDYEFACDVESPNDSTHEYTVRKGELDGWDKNKLERFLESGKGDMVIRPILTHMCNLGIIPECYLSIRVSW